jgi:sugar phosphate isomerase/epimerase
MKFGVTLDSLGDDIRRSADAARAIGFSGVVAPLRSSAVDLTQLSKSGAREFLQLFSSRGLRLTAIQHDLPPTGMRPGGDLDRQIDHFSKAIAAAAALNRAMILCDVGALPPSSAEPVVRKAITPGLAGAIIIPEAMPATSKPEVVPVHKQQPEFEASVSAALMEVARHADREGVTVAFRSSLASFASLYNSLNRAKCPWFGVDLDPISMLADDWPADEIFSRLGSQIQHVRGRDGLRGENRVQPAPIGKGSVDWPAILANLDAAGYGGFISVQSSDLPNRASAAAAGLQHLIRAAAP